MKNYLFGAASIVSLIAASSAHAHDDDGWYLRGNAGYGVHSDATIAGGIDSRQHGNGLQSEGNAAYSLGVGYDFGDNWRVELDADALETSLGSISQTPSSKGSLKTDTLMLNALYDFSEFGKLEPYVGAGIGLVKGKGRFAAHDFPGVANELVRNPTCVGARTAGDASSCEISSSDSGFGWQLLAGLGYQISDKLTWDTHYSYLNGPNLDLDGHIANGRTGDFSLFDAEVSDVGAHTLMTGLRYAFGGHSHSAPKIITPPPAPTPSYKCWDGSMVFNAGQCAAEPAPAPVVQTTTCWDGSIVNLGTACPAQPVPEPAPQIVPTTYSCWDGSIVYDLATCPVQPVAEPIVQRTNLNVCGSSPVAIFDVPVNSTPKQMPRLGTLPEFGDSHGLTATEFYEKLDRRYKSNATDKAYLNYLFRSMGYSNGWADAQPYMFSETVLPVGTKGLLGLGEQHHFNYSILPTNERDRQAFHIQSANGTVIHFMKTCGNYMYACE